MRVAVIGGGPSGLTTLKHLLAAHKFQDIEPIEAKLFEGKGPDRWDLSLSSLGRR